MPDQAESVPIVYRFDDFLLDKQTRTLSRLHANGHRTAVRLGSRAYELLCLLVDRHGEIISQHEIMDVVWPNSAVEPNNLTVQLAALRRALDVNLPQGSCIQNIPGRGYRFVSAVTAYPQARDEDTVPISAVPVEPTPKIGQGAEPEQTEGGATITAVRFLVGRQGWWGRNARRVLAGALGVIALFGVAAWQLNRFLLSRNSVDRKHSLVAVDERPRRSFLILPVESLTNDPADVSFAKVISLTLASLITRWEDTAVVAPSTAPAQADGRLDAKKVGNEFGVRYVVSGFLSRNNRSQELHIALISTETGSLVWSQHFTAARAGVEYTLEELAGQIALAMWFHLADQESAALARARPESPKIDDLLLQARNALYGMPVSPQTLDQARSLFERALELDPSSSRALAGLAEVLLQGITISASDDPAVESTFRRAEALIARAEQLAPTARSVMLTRTLLLAIENRCEELQPAAYRTIELHPTLGGPLQQLGCCLIRAGRPLEAVPLIERAIRVNPRNPQITIRYEWMGYAYLLGGHYAEAVSWLRKALAAHPNASLRQRGKMLAALASALALGGEPDAAREAAQTAYLSWPTLTARGYRVFHTSTPAHVVQLHTVRDGLRLAGVRDHADEAANTGVPADDSLHHDYEAVTPATVPGARTIRTSELVALISQQNPLILDTGACDRTLPGAIVLLGAGVGGSVTDAYQNRLRRKMAQLTESNSRSPIVTVGWNSERFQGYNLALRLVSLGYSNVYWYRGGCEAWEAAAYTTVRPALQEW